MALYAFIPCAPRFPLPGGRGLHPLLKEYRDHEVLRKLYADRYAEAAAAHGVTLAHLWHLPWGRQLPPIPCSGLPAMLTTMHSTAKRTAESDPRWAWLARSFDAVLSGRDGKGDAIYMGGNPTLTPEQLGVYEYLERGVGIAFDAAAPQGATSLIDRLRHHAAVGDRVWVEAARRRDDRLPCIAQWPNWGRPTTYDFFSAPRGSVCWFRQGVNTDAEWRAADLATGRGLDLAVNLSQTKDRARLYKMARATC